MNGYNGNGANGVGGGGSGWRYHKIMQRGWREGWPARLGPLGWCIYYAMILAADNVTGECCWPSRDKVSIAEWARVLDVNRRTVATALAKLLAFDPQLVECERPRDARGRFGEMRYRILDPFASRSEDAAREQIADSSPACVADSPLSKKSISLDCMKDVQKQHMVDVRFLHMDEPENASGDGHHVQKTACGKPFREWGDVRWKLDGRIADSALLRALDMLPEDAITEIDGLIQIQLADAGLAHRALPHAAQIGVIATRVTGKERRVEFVHGC